MMCPSDCILVW